MRPCRQAIGPVELVDLVSTQPTVGVRAGMDPEVDTIGKVRTDQASLRLPRWGFFFDCTPCCE